VFSLLASFDRLQFGVVLMASQGHFLEGYQVQRSHERHYVVQCSAIAANSGWEANNTPVRYIASIHDPAALQLPAPELLMQMYELTKAQARVALAFASGASCKTFNC
jgi:hypothetical protein